MAGESRVAQSAECIVRPARGLDEAHDVWWPLMLVLGWNRSPSDCATHYISSGPNGWLVVCGKDHPHNPEGCVVLFVFENKTGWVGFFVVNEPLRGQGWGAKLFQAGLDYFTAQGVDVIGLDAVQEQVATYGRRGFEEKGLIRLMVREGLQKVPMEGGLGHTRAGEEMVGLDNLPHAVVVASDLEHTGLKRDRLWSIGAMFHREDAWGLAVVKEGTKEELQGWILLRRCQLGWRVGPLYATSLDRAELLLRTAMMRLEGETGTFIAETWPQNHQAVGLFEGLGWAYAGIDYHRMWLHGKVPEQQRPGGTAERQMFAIFDAGEG
jgi:GNAT superfamily N-acetyltransferase